MKDKTISLRLDVPAYAQIITKAHQEQKNMSEYILEKIFQEIKPDYSKYENEIIKLRKEKDELQKKLSDKPKEVLKEVIKIQTVQDDKAINKLKDENKALLGDFKAKSKVLDQLKQKNATEEQKNSLLSSEIKTLNAQVNKLRKDLSDSNNLLNIANKRVLELKTFLNSIDLRQHEDGFSIGGRTFSEGSKIVVQ